jgi:UDP-N-acetylglucosamine acyltransferase
VITQDVMPFSLVVTERGARLFGVNKVGLERRDFSKEAIQDLRKAFRTLSKSGLNIEQAVGRIRAELDDSSEVSRLLRFIESSERGIVK